MGESWNERLLLPVNCPHALPASELAAERSLRSELHGWVHSHGYTKAGTASSTAFRATSGSGRSLTILLGFRGENFVVLLRVP